MEVSGLLFIGLSLSVNKANAYIHWSTSVSHTSLIFFTWDIKLRVSVFIILYSCLQNLCKNNVSPPWKFNIQWEHPNNEPPTSSGSSSLQTWGFLLCTHANQETPGRMPVLSYHTLPTPALLISEQKPLWCGEAFVEEYREGLHCLSRMICHPEVLLPQHSSDVLCPSEMNIFLGRIISQSPVDYR